VHTHCTNVEKTLMSSLYHVARQLYHQSAGNAIASFFALRAYDPSKENLQRRAARSPEIVNWGLRARDNRTGATVSQMKLAPTSKPVARPYIVR